VASRRRSNRPTWSLRVWDVLKGCSPKGPSGARQVSSHRWNCEYSRLWDDLPDGGPLNVYPLREIADAGYGLHWANLNYNVSPHADYQGSAHSNGNNWSTWDTRCG
jgi:hypothetical protein